MPHTSDFVTLPLAASEDEDHLCIYCEADGTSGEEDSWRLASQQQTERRPVRCQFLRNVWLGTSIVLTLTAAGFVGWRLQMMLLASEGDACIGVPPHKACVVEKKLMVGVVAFVVGLWLPTPIC